MGKISELIDSDSIRLICEQLSNLTGCSVEITDLDCKLAAQSNSRRFCSNIFGCRFHNNLCETLKENIRLNPDTEFLDFKCSNGFENIVFPVNASNKQIGTIVIGNFTSENEKIHSSLNAASNISKSQKELMKSIPKISESYKQNIIKTADALKKIMEQQIKSNIELKKEIKNKEEYIKISENLKNQNEILLNALPLPVFYKNFEGKYIGCNKEFLKILGKDYNEIIGKTVYDIAPAEIAEIYDKADKELIKQPDFQMYESKVLFSDNEYHNVIFYKTVFENIKGEKNILGTVLDITQLRKTEQILKENEASLKEITENIDQVFWLFDENGIIYVNSKFEEIFKTDLYEFKNDPKIMNSFISNESKYKNVNLFSINNIIESAQIKLLINNEIKWIRIKNYPILEKDGKIIRAAGIALDVTQRKKMETALRESANNLRLFFDSLPDYLFILDKKGLIRQINSHSSEIIEGDLFESIGKSITDVLGNPPENKKLLKQIIERKIVNTDLALLFKNKRQIYLSLNSWDVNWSGEKALFIMCRDITQRKIDENKILNEKIKTEKLNRELMELNRTKDKFFSIIAHDLKSPFNSIVDLITLLTISPNLSKEEMYELLFSLKNNVENTAELLENLLTWSRSQLNRIEINPIILRLNSAVLDCIRVIKPAAVKKNIEIINSISSQVKIFADKNILNTVLRNLLTNAVKFTDYNGRIEIGCFESEKYLEIFIIDNGIGIPSDKVKNIFSIASTYRNKGTANEKGTGLGLILCKELITKSGGRIWVESKKGEGSKFSFIIPVVRDE